MVFQGDLPFMAVLYQSLQKTETHVDATLGQACGGAIVSSNKVLTLCACVRSFYLVNFLLPKAEAEGEDSDYNNPDGANSPADIVAQDIYLTVWPTTNAEFIGDQKHILDTNNFMSPSTCYGSVESVSEGNKNVGLLQASVVVMMFSPGVTDPPAVIIPLDQVDQSIELYINAFGMSKKNKSEEILHEDQPYDPTAHAVEYKLDYLNATCPYTDYCKKQIFNDAIPKEYEQTMKCLCTQKQYTIQICKGVPGFPITNGEDLIGLTASPVDCESGSVMAYLLDETTIKEIPGNFNISSEEPTFPDLTIPERTTPPETKPNPKVLSSTTKLIVLNTVSPVTAPSIILFPILFYTYMIS